ncbi:hypothetical protein HID58_087796 [Brassica napus]|uniref:pyruvate decarboxylase n=1 Tax=Brassica napus TaxID=3708 RepID=A0ABQ7XUA8_BRANA|nr:hypothetical protein HID58_087796 [Brassica napus]
MDTVIGSIDACNPATGDICRPPNGAVSTVQNSTPAHSTTISPCDATLGRYLARRLVEIGVTDVFSVPGDFNLTLLDHLIAEPSLKLIGCCNELNAGYAADGYARSRGVGACVVTFTVGGLSVLNAIAGAYSENLPLICIVGGPNSNDYGTSRILHHTIGLPDFTQELRCFQAVTCYQAVINNLEEAHELIDTAISTALKESKPVYISISCNLPAIPMPTFSRHPVPFSLAPKVSNQMGLDAAVEAAAEFLNKAVKPVLVGGPKMRDVSTMIRCGQKTIIFLINNGGYTIEVEIHDGPYNVIKNWNYTAFVEAIHNGEGKCWTAKVRCEDELVKAISTATNEEKESFCFIEVIVHKDDTSKELLEWGSRVSAANSRPPNPQ